MVPVPIARGDITVHSEGVLHGSGGNRPPTRGAAPTSSPCARRARCEAERALGFTHSHNDDVAVLEQVDGLTR